MQMKELKKHSLIYFFYGCFVLFMLHRLFFFVPGKFEVLGSYIAYPFLKMRQVVVYPFEQAVFYLNNMQKLQERIKNLQSENEKLQFQLTRFQALQTFDEQSKEIIQFANRYNHKKKLLAHVLCSTVGLSEDCMLLDAGQQQGVCKDHVVVYQDMIIGRVIEVYPWYCKVALITDQRCKIAAQCKKGVPGICCGKNNGELELNYVPHFKDVQVEDVIISTGKGLIYPKGFALGKVISVTSDNVSHFIQAKPLFDVGQLEYVYIFIK